MASSTQISQNQSQEIRKNKCVILSYQSRDLIKTKTITEFCKIKNIMHKKAITLVLSNQSQ